MKSTMSGSAPFGQLPLSETELLTRATLPVVALMLISPLIFAMAGSDAPFAPPDASWTRKYSPGAIVPPFRTSTAPAVLMIVPSPSSRPPLFATPGRVLVVDDERTLRESCASVLQMDGYNVTLVGRGMRSLLHKLSDVWATFGQERVHLISQSSNDLNLTFVVDEAEADGLIPHLHAELIRSRAMPV